MGARSDLTSRVWKAQSARVTARDGQCVSCGATDDLTADHVEAFKTRKDRLEAETGRAWTDSEVAGSYTDDELVTLCRSCNSRKGAREAVRLDYRAAGWFTHVEEPIPFL